MWADRIRPDELHDEAEVPAIRPSRGTHVTLARERAAARAPARSSPPASGRTIFALPWLGRTLVGTTDNDYEGDIDHVAPADDDVDYLLEATNAFFGTDLAPDDITGAYAGVRPLISTQRPKKSVDISRKAELYETSSGMITITGGKLTTWRRMAKMAVDRLVEREDRDAPCRTHEIPLGQAVDADELPRVEGVPEDASRDAGRPLRPRGPRRARARRRARRLAAADRARACPTCSPRPSSRPARAGAHVADVLLRRTRLGLLAARELSRRPRAPERVAAALGRRAGLGRRRDACRGAALPRARRARRGAAGSPTRAPRSDESVDP